MIRNTILPKERKTKFLFFSGKGGVGKSTMSCATAVWIAKHEFRTLIVTTDPAPNLSDIFGQKIGSQITSIDNIVNLSAIEIDPDVASEQYKDRIIAPLGEILDEQNLKVIREQLNSPCVEEVAAFDKFIEFMDDPPYDVVVFDTAPTGHTIRLLELPSGWNEALESSSATCIGPSASLKNVKAKYEKAISYLQDTNRTSLIFVMKPEESSVLETKRSSEELAKLGIKINLLIVNAILPKEACTDEFFKNKRIGEEKVLKSIDNTFKSMPKLLYPLMHSEVSGLELLESVGSFLYEGKEMKDKPKPTIYQKSEIPSIAYDQEAVRRLLAPSNGTRYLFFTGKGGVGKSTIACMASLYMAEKGFRTLIVATDPASHLHNIFGQRIEHKPTQIEGVHNLYAARIDQRSALEEYKNRVMDVVRNESEEVKRSVEEDLNSPCAEEMAAFEKFMSYFDSKEYEIVVFDTAPTGHTLRLLELPVDWKGFLDLGTLTKKASEETMRKYSNVIEAMKSKERSAFVFVMYPEYTPIIEAWRASEELKMQVGIQTSLVAINYILPESYGKNVFFDNRRQQQEKYMAEISERFKTPMFAVPLLEHEPKGLNDLIKLGKKVFGG